MDVVREIISKAEKDLSIENSLRTFEEIWLSKVFELREHKRSRMSSAASAAEGNDKEEQGVSVERNRQ